MKVCATFVFLILPILIYCLTSPLRKETENEITEEPNFEETVYPEFQPEYRYGEVSYYDESYCKKYNSGCRTASGEVFDDTAFTAACSYDYPLGTNLRFYYGENSVVVRCNDRGSFESKYGRIADLSKKAFETLAPIEKGIIKVKIEVLR